MRITRATDKALQTQIDKLLDLARVGVLSDTQWRQEVAATIYVSPIVPRAVHAWMGTYGAGMVHLRSDLEDHLRDWVWLTITGTTISPNRWIRDAPPKVSLAGTDCAASLFAYLWAGLRMQLGYQNQSKSSRRTFNKALRTVLRGGGVDYQTGRVTRPFDPQSHYVSEWVAPPAGREPVDMSSSRRENLARSRFQDPYTQARRLAVSLGVDLPSRPADAPTRDRLLAAVAADEGLPWKALHAAQYGQSPTSLLTELADLWAALPACQLDLLAAAQKGDRFTYHLLVGALSPRVRGGHRTVQGACERIGEIYVGGGLPGPVARRVAINLVDAETGLDVCCVWPGVVARFITGRECREALYREALSVLDFMMGCTKLGVEGPTVEGVSPTGCSGA